MTLNGILMRISNTPPYLLVCRILTNNVEVGTYGCKIPWEGIHDDRARGRCRNLETSIKRNFAVINKINNIFRIFRDSTFSVVAALGR